MTGQALAATALAGTRPVPYWLDQPDAPLAGPALAGETSAALAVVGGGFTGLWTALLASERDPSADIVLLEGRSVGWAASGRNGGFCAASLTHGLANGMARFPAEMAALVRLGQENLDEIAATLEARGIDCGFERTGELAVATAPWQLPGLADDAAAARAYGEQAVLLDAGSVRRELDSPSSALADRLRTALATVVAIPVTPFDAAGGVDWDAHARLAGLAQLGLCGRAVRPPSRLLPEAVRSEIAAILASWGLGGAGESS